MEFHMIRNGKQEGPFTVEELGQQGTIGDIVKFNKQYIKDKPKTYMILATDGEVDLDAIAKMFGPVTKLTLEDIFGY